MNKKVRHNYEFNIFSISIDTLEGSMEAEIGDYIIKGVHGEIYPCKPDIFHKTYELIDTEEILEEE